MAFSTADINWVLWCALISVPFFVFAWKRAWAGNFSHALIALLIGGLLLRLGPALDPLLHTWDERYHALVAKNMMAHPFLPTLYERHVLSYDPLSWTEGHVWFHKPPLTLWCMMVSMKVFGATAFAARIPSLLFSTLGIAVCFAIVRRSYGQRTAFVAAFLFAIQGAIIEFGAGRCATDHVDTLFTFLIGCSVLAYQRSLDTRRWMHILLAGITLAAAILTKWLPALIVLPVQALLAWNNGRSVRVIIMELSSIAAIAACVAAPWSIYVLQRFPGQAEHESLLRVQHLTHVLDEQGGPWWYYLDRLRIAYGELVYLPCLWVLWKVWRSPKDPKRWVLIIWIGGLFAFFSFAATKMPGYVLPATIPIVTVTALFWVVLEKGIRRNARLRWLGYVVLIALLALPVRYCLERLKPIQDLSDQRRIREQLIALSSDDPAHPTVVLNCKRSIEAMFYANCVAYERTISPELADSLRTSGFRVVEYSDIR